LDLRGHVFEAGEREKREGREGKRKGRKDTELGTGENTASLK